MAPTSVLGVRGRQASALAGTSARVLKWRPLGQVMLAALAFVAIGSRAGVALRLSIASAAVAAASGFLLDDPAAVTLAASPTSLPLRRLQRVSVVAAAVGLWWAAVAVLATRIGGGFPLRGRALELCVFVAVTSPRRQRHQTWVTAPSAVSPVLRAPLVVTPSRSYPPGLGSLSQATLTPRVRRHAGWWFSPVLSPFSHGRPETPLTGDNPAEVTARKKPDER